MKHIYKIPSKLIATILSIVIYVSFIFVLLIYFNETNKSKEVNYVEEDNKISVKMISGTKEIKKNKVEIKNKTKVKKRVKSSRKKRSNKKGKKKRDNLKLFNNVKVNKTKTSEFKSKPAKRKRKVTVGSKEVKVNKDKGVEGKYLAKIQTILYGWPAQSDYAGKRAIVHLSIKKDGSFTFRLKERSKDDDFNKGLITYLKQLKNIGFGRHNSKKIYSIEVIFVAKE